MQFLAMYYSICIQGLRQQAKTFRTFSRRRRRQIFALKLPDRDLSPSDAAFVSSKHTLFNQ